MRCAVAFASEIGKRNCGTRKSVCLSVCVECRNSLIVICTDHDKRFYFALKNSFASVTYLNVEKARL